MLARIFHELVPIRLLSHWDKWFSVANYCRVFFFLLAHFGFLQSGNRDRAWSPFVFSGTEASFIMCGRACGRAFKKFETSSQAEHRVCITLQSH